MRWRRAFAAGVLATSGCSLFTDLGGFDEPEDKTILVVQEAGGGSDGEGARDADTPPDAGFDAYQVPIQAKYVRTLTVQTSTAPVSAGAAACTVLANDLLGVAVAAGKMRADFADLRIQSASGAATTRTVDVLPNARALVCFRLDADLPASSSSAYEMHYGDPLASAASTAGVWTFVEEFDSAPSSPLWNLRGAPTVTGGRLKLAGGGVNAIATAAASDGIPVSASIVMSVQLTNPSSAALPKDAGNGDDNFFWWFGLQRYGDFNDYDPWSVFIGRAAGTVKAEHKQSGSGPCVSTCVGPESGQTNATRIYRIDRGPDGVRFVYDDGTAFEAPGSNGDMAIMLRNSLQSSDMFVDWVRARPIVWPEPTVTVGPETAL